MYNCTDISYYPPPLLPLSLLHGLPNLESWWASSDRLPGAPRSRLCGSVAHMHLCRSLQARGCGSVSPGVAQRLDRLLVTIAACLSGQSFAYLGRAVLLSLFGMSLHLELTLRLEFGCFLLKMAFLLLSLEREGVGKLLMVHVHVGFASLYLGLLPVSVLFLRQIISHLILACDPLDSLYLYLFWRLLDFSANPFPLVRRLRLVPSLSLGVIEVC